MVTNTQSGMPEFLRESARMETEANPLDILYATTLALSRLDRRAVPQWSCKECGAKFSQPSFSDASDIVHDHDTGFAEWKAMVVAVCPMCASERVKQP